MILEFGCAENPAMLPSRGHGRADGHVLWYGPTRLAVSTGIPGSGLDVYKSVDRRAPSYGV